MSDWLTDRMIDQLDDWLAGWLAGGHCSQHPHENQSLEINLSGGEAAEEEAGGKHYVPLSATISDASLRLHQGDRPLETIRATLGYKVGSPSQASKNIFLLEAGASYLPSSPSRQRRQNQVELLT